MSLLFLKEKQVLLEVQGSSLAFLHIVHRFAAMWPRILNALSLVFLLGVNSCGGGNKDAKSAADYSMSPAEARTYILEVRKGGSAVPPDPSTMAEVFDILANDDIRRFEGASRYTAGMQGVEGLSVRATIELMSADIYSTVGDLVEELSRRSQKESDRLRMQKERGVELSAAEQASLEKSVEQLELLDKAKVALRVLADVHLEEGGSLSMEAMKQYPKDPSGYRTGAYYYLLDSNWPRYDDMMESLDGAGVVDAGMSYFRAIESLKRNLDKDVARELLIESLQKNPQLVRAQAELVLVQDDIESRYREFLKLKAMKKDHPIVNLAGPAIESEYEVTLAVRAARGEEPSSEVEDVSTDAMAGGGDSEAGDELETARE